MNLFWKCAVAVVSSAIQSLGLTLQRASYLTPSLGSNAATSSSNIYLWRLGVALFIGANLFGSTVQIALLPLVLVCSLQAAGLVANSFFAWILLQEPLTTPAIAGTCLIITGAVFVAAFGGVRQADPVLSLDELVSLLYQRHFIFYMAASLALVFACIFRAHRTPRHDGSVRGFLYGIAGGILSAHSLLMAKIVIGLLVCDVRHILRYVLRTQFWGFLLLFAAFALGQMWCVNSSLQRVSTSVLYPLIFCVYNITTLLNGFSLYGLSTMLEPRHFGIVVFGTFLLMLGVGLLSSRLEDEGDTCDTEAQTSLNTPQSSPLSPTLPLYEPRLPSLGETISAQPESPVPPRTALPCANRSRADSPLLDTSAAAIPQYTSFETLNPNIANPDKSRNRPGRHGRGRVLSKEQQDILRELYM